MEKKFEEIWKHLVSDYDYEEGDIVPYEDVLEATSILGFPLLSMQEVSDFEKKYNIDIEWWIFNKFLAIKIWTCQNKPLTL